MHDWILSRTLVVADGVHQEARLLKFVTGYTSTGFHVVVLFVC
jgi:hypothetical protein